MSKTFVLPTEETLLLKTPTISKIPQGKASPFSILFLLIHCTIGAGILSLPYAFKACGVVLGPILLLCIGSMTCYAVWLLLFCAEKTGKYSFKELAVHTFGKWCGVSFEACRALVSFGVCIIYIVLIGSSLSSPMSQWVGEESFFASRYFITSVAMVGVLMPLCSLRRIHFLSSTSTLAVGAIGYMVLIVFIRFVQRVLEFGFPSDSLILVGKFYPDIVTSFPIFFFSFGSVIAILPLYKDLRRRSVIRMGGISSICTTLCIVFYFIMGFSGYSIFAEKPISDNVLASFPNDDIGILVARVFITLVVLFCYPLMHFACRESIEHIFFAGKEFSWTRWIGIMLCICGATFLLGVFIPSIVTILGLFLAIPGVCVEFVFPICIYIKMEKNIWKRGFSFLVAIVSVFLGGIAFVSTIIKVVG